MSAISWKTKVEMFDIQESEITIIERVTPSNLSAVPGTMKLHPGMSVGTFEIFYLRINEVGK